MNPSNDNSFGSLMNYTGPVGSGTGDIILSSSAPKKPRKWLIVVIVSLVLLVVGVGGFFLVKAIVGDRWSQDEIDVLIQNMTDSEAFNGYYNLLVYGDESAEPDGLPETWFIEDMIASGYADSLSTGWFTKIKKYYNGFVAKYNRDDDVLIYSEMLGLYLNLARREEILEDVSRIRNESGDAAADQFVDNLINLGDYEGVLNSLAINEALYFKSTSDNSYPFSPSYALVDLTMDWFKTRTKTLNEELGENDVEEE